MTRLSGGSAEEWGSVRSEHLVISEAPDVVFGYMQLADSCCCELGEDHAVSDDGSET